MVPLGSVVDRVPTWDPRREGTEPFKYLDLSSIDAQRKQVDGFSVVSPADAPSRARQLVQAGDVLVSTVRPNLNAVAMVTDEIGPATASTGFSVLRPRQEEIDGRYLFHWVRFGRFIGEMVRLATGASYPAVSDAIVRRSEIPLPPIEDQRRIAAVLDAADALRAKRREALAKLDTLTQAIFIDLFGDPLAPTPEVATSDLSRVATFVRGISFKPDEVVDGTGIGEVPVMRTANVQAELDLSDVWHVSRDRVRRPEQWLQPLDVLISSANSWNLVGRCCLVPPGLGEATLGGFVTALRPSGPELRKRFLHAWFSSSKVQQTVRSFGRKTTNISNLDMARCGRLPIPVPPMQLQLEFERQLDALAVLSDKGPRNLERLDALFVSLQQRAFRGVL